MSACPQPSQTLEPSPDTGRRVALDRARRVSVAPMMDWTDSACRRFHRLLTREALLYTEMLHANAVIHGDRARLLRFDAAEQPLAVQLGGSEPAALAEAARICADAGFAEINLNVGCPSERVQSGAFGACLMAEPALVAECVAAMRAAVGVPVTVKHRIGIDDQDSEADLERFVTMLADAGCDAFIVHARKAWLKGLDPKANREVPPLDYGRVQRLKARHPGAFIVLNGGLRDVRAARRWLEPDATGAPALDGVMFGRVAYHEPRQLLAIDGDDFGDPVRAVPADVDATTLAALIDALAELAAQWVAEGEALPHLTRHVLGLCHGLPAARQWRRTLTEQARVVASPAAAADLVRRAAAPVLDALVQAEGSAT